MHTGVAKPQSPWAHRLALTLLCATFPLIWIGGLVTTTDAGMAVPDWPNTYGYNLFLYPWQKWIAGPWDLFVEHGHRLFAAAVGLVTIVLAVVLWRCDDRKWIRILGLVTLAAVIFQGVLGGLRVVLDARLLALLHGCVAPAFFALCAALTTFTSARWTSDTPPRATPDAGKLQRVALLTTLFAYFQVVLGANLRHAAWDLAPSSFRGLLLFHLFLAAVLVIHAAVLAAGLVSGRWHQAGLLMPAWGLVGLIVLQILLGAGAWVVNYAWPSWLSDYGWAQRYVVVRESLQQTLVTTAHAAIGSLIVVTALVLSLRSLRLRRSPSGRAGVRPRSLEAAV